MLAREAGPQDRLVERTGIPRATLQRILAGKGDPGPERLAVLAEALGTTVEHLTSGVEADESVALVNVYDVEVAAGPGRVPFGEEPIGTWPFPAKWLRAEFGDRAELKLFRVAGDSQEPELRDGDSVMIDTYKPRLREGMHVVRLDDRLLLKRIQIEGATVRLKSANAIYDDVLVDLAKDGDGFAVVGRAVWSSKRW